MLKILKTITVIFLAGAIYSCSNPYKEELVKSGKSGAALGRIGASQSGSESIFKDID